jgi:hypothetical protein
MDESFPMQHMNSVNSSARYMMIKDKLYACIPPDKGDTPTGRGFEKAYSKITKTYLT